MPQTVAKVRTARRQFTLLKKTFLQLPSGTVVYGKIECRYLIILSKRILSLIAVLVFAASFFVPATLFAQQTMVASADPTTLPNAPLPQTLTADSSSSDSSDDQATQQNSQSATPPSQQTPDTQNQTEEDRRAKAAEELKQEESQRMAGIIPNFNAVNNGQAVAITPGQKFHLFFKGAVDPYQFALAGVDAGIGQAEDSNPGYNQGFKGFARRYGANYGDNFDGNFWGNAVLPSLLHQDPRYFRMGHGPVLRRVLYSISTTVRTRGDDGNWQLNVSNLTGNLIGAAISNAYYPDGDVGLYPTLRRGLSVTYQGTIGALLEEFYPDVADHYKRRHAAKLAAKAAAETNP